MSETGVNLVTHLDTYHRFHVVIIDQSMWHLGSVGTFSSRRLSRLQQGSGDEDGCAGPLPRFTDDDVDEVLLQ
jgi:hypothetical protein